MPLTASQSGHGLTHRRMLSGTSSESATKSQSLQRRDPLKVVSPMVGKQNLPLPSSSPSPQQQKLQLRTSSLNHLHSPQSPPAPGRSNQPRRERNLSGPSVTATTIEPRSPHHVPKLHGSKNVSREPSIPRSRHESISHGDSVIPSTTATASSTAIAGTLPSPTVSTSTTFYSGVKLAPPVKSASVEGVERRTSDQKVWYTIQVYPYDLTIPSCANGGSSETARAGGVRGSDGIKGIGRGLKTNSITRPADTGSSSSSAGMSFPRKPYKIYRQYEDVENFSDQLEQELPRLLEAAKAASATKTTKSRLPSASASVTASPTTSTLREQKGDLGTAIITNSPSRRSPRGSTLVSPLGPAGSNTRAGVRDNASPASGSHKGNPTMSIKSSRTSKCLDTSANMNAQATRINAGGTVGEGPSTLPDTLPEISLPRLKSSGLVLFMTKTVCLQRKSDLDRYLQELFSSNALGHGLLGPIIAHSRLVAEFFGIWKTDMEAHLRQEDCDPLALHSVAIPPSTPSTTGTSANRTSTSVDITAGTAVPILPLSVSHEEQLKEDRYAENRTLTLLSFENRDSSPQTHPTVVRSPPSSHSSSDPCKKADSTARKISASSFPSVPTSIHPPSAYLAHSRTTSTLTSAESPQKQHQNVETTMHLSYPSTNSTSPSPVAHSPRQLRASPRSMGRTAESTAQPVGSTAQSQQQRHCPPVIRSPMNILDSDMASPTKVSNCAVIQDDVIHPLATTTASVAASHQERKTVPSAEEDPAVDITVRTIKKFKSLPRIQTPGLSGTHPQHRHQQQDAKIQHEAQALEGPSPASDVATLESITPQLRPVVTASSHGQAPSLQAGLPMSKLTRRSKTTVSRPEVAMQPLSSKNVIPPWNRIPAVAGISTGNLGISTSSPTSPRSPDSPRTPRCRNAYGIDTPGSPGTVIGENVTATTPTTRDPEERPRKLTSSSSPSQWGGGPSSPSATVMSTSGPQSSSSPALASPSIGNGNPNNGTMNSTMYGQRSSSRSMSISSVSSSSNSTLIAPWNRVQPNAEPNTHLHSLVKLNGGSSSSTSGHQVPTPPSSSSNSTHIPVELGKSYLKKEGLQKSYTIATTRSYSSVKMDRGRSTPVLTLIPEGKSKEPVHGASEDATRSGKSERSGMTHSVSAPGGFLPTTTATTADTSQTTSKIATLLNKRAPRRESATSLHSPSMPKQPTGILKNSGRKASPTVPGTGIFPVLPPSPTSPTSTIGHRHGSSVATTFKIVMDADTIVALQVFEDKDFILTLDELQKRVKGKLLKSNIQLPDTFDFIWMMPSSTSSSGSNTPMTPMTPSAPPSPGFASSTLIHPQSGQGLVLKTEEDLQRAIHSSRNHKVTLKCAM